MHDRPSPRQRRVSWHALIPLFMFLVCLLGSGGHPPSDTVGQPAHGVDNVVCPAYDASTLPTPLPASPTASAGTIAGSFAVAPGGQATYTIPLVVPPGRLGMEPKLAIAYDSGRGEGPVGVGFALQGLSAITRCPSNMAQDGRIRAVHYDTDDKFCLDGLRLVRVPGTDGADGTGSTEWRTFPDTMRKVVSRSTDRALGPQSWTVYERDGRIREYGATADSQALATGGVVAAWWLAREHDRHSNEVAYTYSNEPFWFDGHTQEILIRSIDYTSNGSTAATRRVSFTYEHTTVSTLFLGGLSIIKSHLLTQIDAMTMPHKAVVRSYHLDYRSAEGTHRNTLQSISECAGDGTCKPPTRFTWTDHLPELSERVTPVMVPPAQQSVQLDEGFGKWVLADVNGDGLDDLVVVLADPDDESFDDWNVALNIGGAFDEPTRWGRFPHPQTQSTGVLCDGNICEDEWVLTPMDFDQDGRTDILLDTANPEASSWPRYRWLRSRPDHSFELRDTAIPQPPGISYWSKDDVNVPYKMYSNRYARVGDVNGDGIGDLIQCVNPTWDGEGYNPSPGHPIWTVNLWVPDVPGAGGPGWDPNPIPIPDTSAVDCAFGLWHVHVVDIDGDGTAEILMPNDNLVYGGLRFENGNWTRIQTSLPVQAWQPFGGTRIIHWLDANGDGLADAFFTGLGTTCEPGEANCENPDPFTINGWPYDVPFSSINNGAFFGYPTGTLHKDLGGQFMTDAWGDQGIALDYDGDGRTDFMLPVSGECADHGSEACWVVLRSSATTQGYSTGPNAPVSSGVAIAHIPTKIGEIIDSDTGMVHTWFNPQVTDVNGDGRHDLVAPSIIGDGSFTIYTNSGPQDLLVSVTDGMSALDPGEPGFVPTVTIEYGSLVDRSITRDLATSDPQAEQELYLKHADETNDCTYPRSCVVGPSRVVSSYAINDGQNQQRTFSVKYRDGRYHRLGRGMLGFGERIVTDEDTGAGRVEIFDNHTWDDTLHVNPFVGQVTESRAWGTAAANPSGKPTQIELSYGTTTLQEVPTEPNTYFTIATGTERVRKEGTFDPTSGETLEDYARKAEGKAKGVTVLSDTLTVVSSFDPTFGDVLQQDTIARGVDLHDSVTRTVQNDANRWLLGEATYEEACSQALGTTQCRTTSRTFDGYGQVKEVVTGDPQDPDTYLTSDYFYDGFGNVKLTTAYEAADDYRSACTSYEPEGIFPYATVNQAGHTTLFAFDSGLGVLTGSVDPNGLETRFQHDGFGRLTEERHPDGSYATYALSRHKNGGPQGDWWAVEATATIGGGPVATRQLDSLGRTVHAWAHVADTKSCGESTCNSMLRLEQETTYDHLGRVTRVTSPWIEGDALTDKLADGYDYDAIGRTTVHVEPWGHKTTYKYTGNVASATDWLGTTKREVDALGRVVKTTDKAGGTVETKYGPFSLPYAVTRLGNETTTTVRDAYGRVLEEDDPDRGTTITRYDGFGEVVTIDDAAARHFAFAYDGIGRLVQRDDTVNSETRTTNWNYDTSPHGIGRIAQVTSPDGHVDAYTYTKHSQPETHTLTLADTGESFSSALTYDGVGRVSVVTYPQPAGVDPLAVRHEYDAFGNVVALRDDTTGAPYWTLAQLDGAGRPNEEVLGNGVVVKRQYEHDSGVVKRIQATWQAKGKSAQLQDLRYEYDQGLRMTSRTDALQTGPLGYLEEGFGYDAIDRLTCVRASASQPPRSLCANPIHYAQNGNIETKDGLAYAYDPAHPHAVQAVGAGSYENDAVGNQIERPGMTIGYTPFDLPESYTFDAFGNGPSPGNVRLEYDGDQHRIRKTLLDANGGESQETVYLDSLYERVRSGDDTHRFYVAAGSAMVVITRGAGGDQVAYALTDALGSVDKITDGAGGVIEQRSYDAFGARRNPAGWGPWQGPLASGVTPVGFEGLEADDEAGLVNMRGRVYDPKIGRFLSTDPLVSRPGFAQSWNPFSYVLNSPLNLADPSGFDPVMTATGQDGVTYGTGPALHVGAGENMQMVLKLEHGIGAAPEPASAPKDAGRNDTPAKASQSPSTATEVAKGVATGVYDVVKERFAPSFEQVEDGVWQYLRAWSGTALADNVIAGARKDGVLGAVAGGVNTVNPLYQFGVQAAGADDKSQAGDIKGAAEGYTVAAIGLFRGAIGLFAGGEGEGAPESAPEAAPTLPPQLGGPYGQVRAAASRAGLGGEVHHMPAWAATRDAGTTGLTRGSAPSIWMTAADHASTPSFQNRTSARLFRAQQEALIRSGSYLDALKMDVDAIRSEFGTRYDGAIQQLGEQFWKAGQ